MIRVHRSKYSAVRVEGVCFSTEIVECGVKQDTSRHRPILIAPRLDIHSPDDDHSQQDKPPIKPRSET